MHRSGAVIYLVRHAHSTANGAGVLAGRDNSVGLSELGLTQADLLAERLEALGIKQIVRSPLKRCRQTIAPLIVARKKNSKSSQPIVDSRVVEMNYGSWSGKSLKTLAKKPLWSLIQSKPSTVTFPEGESFLEMSARANSAFVDYSKPGSVTCIVSHGDVIKAILAAQLGLSVDSLQKFAVDPASISAIAVSGSSSFLLYANDTSHLRVLHSKSAKTTPPSNGGKYILGGGAGSSSKAKK